MRDSHTVAELDAAALITIDMQRDVLDDGSFPVPGTSDVLPAVRRVVEAFRRTGRPIVHIVRLYERDGSNAERCRRGLLAGGAQLVIRDTPGCQLAGELVPDPGLRLDSELLLTGAAQSLGPHEVALYKPRWGAFYRTALEAQLREQGISTVVFVGCNFPNCPRTSIYEASERDFRVVVVGDAISGLYDRGTRELLDVGMQLITADELTRALGYAARETSHVAV